MSSMKDTFLIVFIVSVCFLNVTKTESLVSGPESSFASQNNNNNFNHRQYNSAYTNGGSQYPASSRDSFLDSAVSVLGVQNTNNVGSYPQGQPIMYNARPHRQSFGDGDNFGLGGGGGDDFEGNDLGGGGGGSGAIGLLGLLGLKGLKGVGLFKIAKAFAILSPILMPILGPVLSIVGPILLLPLLLLLLPLLLGPILPVIGPLVLLAGLLAILFIPIPVITIPGRSATTSVLEAARGAFESSMTEDCAERITCEISRAAKLYGLDPPWVTNMIEKSSSKSKWGERISQAYTSTECTNYECGIVSSFKKMLKLN